MGISVPILSSLRTRILALVLGLVTLVVAAMATAIAVKARAEVERQVGVQLRSAADTAREALKFHGGRLTGAVELLTTDFGFREAVASGDKPTLLSAVENQRARINADLVIVLSQEGRPVVSTLGALTANTENDLQNLIANDADSETLQLYRLIDGRPYQLVLAPILAPEPIGWAAIGFALDDGVAKEMSRLLGVDVSFVAGGEQDPTYLASSRESTRATESSYRQRHSGFDANTHHGGVRQDINVEQVHPLRQRASCRGTAEIPVGRVAPVQRSQKFHICDRLRVAGCSSGPDGIVSA